MLTNHHHHSPAATVSMKKKKTSNGRKKIEIKKIEETNSRQVTFSKRRTGLFKKASELCILTGAQVGILVNSPGGRVFAFGHPNVDSLLDRYLKDNSNDNNNNAATINGNSPPSPAPPPVIDFNQHYMEVSRELEAEKKIMIIPPSSSSSGGGGMPWWFDGASTDGMETPELERFLYSLVELKKKVITRADDLSIINNNGFYLNGSLSALFH